VADVLRPMETDLHVDIGSCVRLDRWSSGRESSRLTEKKPLPDGWARAGPFLLTDAREPDPYRLHDLHKLIGHESDQLDEDESNSVGLALAVVTG
jgi:hypothetical protein